MTRDERAAARFTKGLLALAWEQFYLEAATPEEVRLACLSILGDIYDDFDRKIPAGTKLPYRKEY